MLILKKIHIENFMSVDYADFEVADSQFTAITGPNGSGKSTLLYAVLFALSGYRRGESIKDYIKAGTDTMRVSISGYFKGLPVSYDVEVLQNKKSFVTNRTVKYDGKTYLNSDFSQFLASNGMEHIEELMFMLQGGNNIIDSKPSERASLLKKLFNFQFPTQVELLKNRQEVLKTECIENETIRNELSSRVYDRMPLLREVVPKQIDIWNEQIEDIDAKIRAIGDVDESEIKNCEQNIIATQRQINDMTSKVDSDSLSISSLKTRLNSINAELDAYDGNAVESALCSLRASLSVHEMQYEEDRNRDKAMRDELSILEYKEKECSSHYEISKTGVCHSCGQTVEKSYIENLKEMLDSTKRAIKDKKAEIKELNFDKRDTQGKSIRSQIEYNESLVKAHGEHIALKENLLSRIEAMDSLIAERTNTLEDLKLKLNSYLAEKQSLKEKEKLLSTKQDLLTEKETIKTKLQTARDNMVKNVERKFTNARMEEDEKERDSRVQNLNKKYNELSVDMNIVKQSLAIFEKDYPNYIILNACVRLENIINSIVQRVFPYCVVSLKMLKGGLNFFYTTDSSEEWIPVSMASGAQKQVFNIAYFVALAMLNNVECIFLDEVDASMTSENASIIYDFIAGLDCFPQVFFISHREEAHETVRAKKPSLVTYSVNRGNYTEL